MKRKIIPVLVAVFLIIIVAAIALGNNIIKRYSYSKTQADMNEYFGMYQEDDVALVLQNDLLEEKAKLLNGIYYLDFITVQTYFNARFYWDTEEHLLIYTTPTDIISTAVDSKSVTMEGNTKEESYVPATYYNGSLYVAIDYVKKYTNFSYEAFTEPNRIQVYTEWSSQKTADIKKDTAVRYQGGVKSDILEQVEKGTPVIILEELEKWSKVKTPDAVMGYVENKRLTNHREEEQAPVQDYAEPVYTNITRDKKINLVWHQVTNMTANGFLQDLIGKTKAVNVVSPTWFSLSDNEGNFTSLASEEYVANAHNMGLEVWGLVDNFSTEVDTNQVLSAASRRAFLIQNLVNTALQYRLDGINIDFETISVEAGENFIQFIRELSIACRANGIVLSVDNYVPKEYSAHYNRKEQGIVADYIIVMGYDEHTAGGGTAGSVASIDFVEEGIQKTIEEVPSQKVINALPFYTRVWKTAGGEVSASSVAMGVAEKLLGEHGAEVVWNEETCQNYGEYTAEDTLYQVWLEDAESIVVKLNIMKNYDLAGVASWKLGLETADVWDAVAEYVGN